MIRIFVRSHKTNLSSRLHQLFILLLVAALQSCAYYKQDIMFKTDGTANAAAMQMAVAEAEQNYKIRVNDYVDISVYTNDGERLVDPNFEFVQQVGAGGGGSTMRQQAQRTSYLVQHNGMAKLPMVGMVKLEGLTHQQADSLLEVLYNQFYEEAFVTCRVESRRVIVLGATSGGEGGGKIIPLDVENISLIEVLARAGGLTNFAKSYNIKLIRGDLKNPHVQVIDLSTLDGMRKAELTVLPNDIIYVEPGRRPALNIIRDYSPLLSLTSSLITLFVLINARF